MLLISIDKYCWDMNPSGNPTNCLSRGTCLPLDGDFSVTQKFHWHHFASLEQLMDDHA